MSSKEKAFRIAVDVILIVLGIVFLIFGIKDVIDKYDAQKTPDNLLFKDSYRSVSDDNPYVYLSRKEYDKFTSGGTGVVFVANPTDPRAQVVASPLANVTAEYGLDIVYYLEVDEDEDLQILVIENGETITNLSKEDIFDENYEGTLAEYFKETKYYLSFKESLKSIEEIND